MSLTEEVVRFVESADPSPGELAAAAAQVARFRRACADGAGSTVARALTELAGNSDDPLWTAWISGAAAATDPELAWVAVCAAVTAVAGDDERAAEATAIGYQVAARVAEALGDAHTAAGWSARATAGVVGAGAAVGWLLALDRERLRNALGVCATQAAGLTGVAGTDAESLQVGKAAANAVEAGLLAECGFTSSAAPLEGRRGLIAVMSI